MGDSETCNFSSEKQVEKSSDNGEERSSHRLSEEQVGTLSLEEGALSATIYWKGISLNIVK